MLLSAIVAPAGASVGASNDLTQGAVFGMSNAREGNTVVAYYRNANGTLTEAGRFDTRGLGSGSFEDTANGLVLGTSVGEAAPNNLIELGASDQQLLFVTNAGSNSISVFKVNPTGLELVDLQDSQGEKPVSITVNDGLAYVLNSGETNDDLFDAAGNVIPNCTTGRNPSVTGFTLSPEGQLTPIQGSAQSLSGERVSGCAQVSFNPSGDVLVVTERLAKPKQLGQQTSAIERLDDEGVIVTFNVASNGRLTTRRVIDATGQGPFGFTFAKNSNLLTTEQFDGPDGPGLGAAASYVVNSNGSLLRSSPSIQNGGTDTCWFVITDSQTIGFTTSFFGEGQISSYEVDEIGLVRLIDSVATGPNAVDDNVAPGASDMSLSGDSHYLYQLNSLNGTITAFANNGDGSLTLVQQVTPFPQPPFGPGMGMGAPLGLAAH